MSTKELKKLSELSTNERSNVRHYAKDGRVKLIKTKDGLCFDEEEYINAKKENKRINKTSTKTITNKDFEHGLYTTMTMNTHAGHKARYLFNKGLIEKFYNTQDSKMYCKIIDLLQREIQEISETTGIPEDDIIEFISNEIKKNNQKPLIFV